MITLTINIIFLLFFAFLLARTPKTPGVFALVAAAFIASAAVEAGIVVLFDSDVSLRQWIRYPLLAGFAIAEELAKLGVILIVFYRGLFEWRLRNESLCFIGLSYGLIEYAFKVIGWSNIRFDETCTTDIVPVACQNLVLITPLSMHLLTAMTYALALPVKDHLIAAIVGFSVCLAIAIFIHYGFNHVAVSFRTSADRLEFIYIFPAAVILGLIVPLSLKAIVREVKRRFRS